MRSPATGRIRFVPSDEETRQVLLPVEFSFVGRDENAWSRIVFVPRAQDSWVDAAIASPDGDVEEFDVNGRAVDGRIALLTEIDDPWL